MSYHPSPNSVPSVQCNKQGKLSSGTEADKTVLPVSTCKARVKYPSSSHFDKRPFGAIVGLVLSPSGHKAKSATILRVLGVFDLARNGSKHAMHTGSHNDRGQSSELAVPTTLNSVHEETSKKHQNSFSGYHWQEMSKPEKENSLNPLMQQAPLISNFTICVSQPYGAILISQSFCCFIHNIELLPAKFSLLLILIRFSQPAGSTCPLHRY